MTDDFIVPSNSSPSTPIPDKSLGITVESVCLQTSAHRPPHATKAHGTHPGRLPGSCIDFCSEDDNLASPSPSHSHPAPVAETHVHMVKQGLKRKAAESDVPTKYLVAEAVGRLNFETRAKLNCGLDSLHKMV